MKNYLPCFLAEEYKYPFPFSLFLFKFEVLYSLVVFSMLWFYRGLEKSISIVLKIWNCCSNFGFLCKVVLQIDQVVAYLMQRLNCFLQTNSCLILNQAVAALFDCESQYCSRKLVSFSIQFQLKFVIKSNTK